MPKLDRYLSREFAQSVFAALIVLGMVSMGGLVADLLSEIARGKVPAGLLLSQLGLRLVDFLPILLPLSLMVGLLLSLGRLYRDSEMQVLAAVGVGPRRLLKPVLIVVLPVLAVVALCSLWLGPWANRLSEEMVQEANKNLLVSGLEAGPFHRACPAAAWSTSAACPTTAPVFRGCSCTGRKATGSMSPPPSAAACISMASARVTCGWRMASGWKGRRARAVISA